MTKIAPKIENSNLKNLEYISCSKFAHSFQVTIRPNKCPHIVVNILGTNVHALLDSGASASILSSTDIIKKHNFQIHPINLKIRTADKTAYKCEGVVHIPFTYNGQTRVVSTLLVPQIAKPLILGIDFWESFQIAPAIVENGQMRKLAWDETGNSIHIIEDYFAEPQEPIILAIEPEGPETPIEQQTEDKSLELPFAEHPGNEDIEEVDTEHDLTVEEQEELNTIVKEFKNINRGLLGQTKVLSHKINLIPGAQPKKPPHYRCSPHIQKEVDKEVVRMLELNLIEESQADWCNPLLPVKKASGEWRICLDCRRINEVTKNEAYPFPDMLGILGRIEKSKYFTVIDLSKAYWQIPLEEASRDFTSFRAGKQLYRFKVMPFGLKGAPISQTKLMNKVLGYDLEPNVYVYLDDIIVVSKTLAEHFRLLRVIRERLEKANLTISISKSKFCQKTISYLGYTLSEHGLAIDSSKVRSVLDYAVPKTPRDVRRFIGMVSFYKQFISRFSDLTAPITDLLKKDKGKLIWNKEADEAFWRIKSILTSPNILANPDFNEPFIIESDASDVAVGAVLIQVQGGIRRPIAFFSKKLSASQKKYAPTEKECLGVILAIEKFRQYVEGSKFTVITDAQSLIWLRKISAEKGSAKLIRWALKLQQYDFDLVYRKGALNVTADALSRSVEHVTIDDLDYEELKGKIINDRIKYKNFRVTEDRIYKIVSTKDSDARFHWKYLPPKQERLDFIREAHDSSHFGRFKTLKKLQEKYYWPAMEENVRRYCQGCDTCKATKHPNTNRKPLMGKQKVASVPWQIISVDFVGPLPRSKNGNSVLLVVTDLFSKFVVVQPLREAKTHALINFLENMVFLMFAVPEIVISDNGSQFKSKEFEKFLAKYHVTHWKNANYHPANNPTERVNRVIGAAIRASLTNDHTEWDKNIQKIAMSIRSAVHESTGFTPYFVNYGRNYISSGVEYRRIRETVGEVDHEPLELNENIKKIFDTVKTNLKKAYERYAKHYNLRSNQKNPDFEIGEHVMKKNFFQSSKIKQFSAKLANPFSPAKIVRKIGSSCYELEDVNGNYLGVFHASDLQKK